MWNSCCGGVLQGKVVVGCLEAGWWCCRRRCRFSLFNSQRFYSTIHGRPLHLFTTPKSSSRLMVLKNASSFHNGTPLVATTSGGTSSSSSRRGRSHSGVGVFFYRRKNASSHPFHPCVSDHRFFSSNFPTFPTAFILSNSYLLDGGAAIHGPVYSSLSLLPSTALLHRPPFYFSSSSRPSKDAIFDAYQAAKGGRLRDIALLVEQITAQPIEPLSINDIILQAVGGKRPPTLSTTPNPAAPSGLPNGNSLSREDYNTKNGGEGETVLQVVGRRTRHCYTRRTQQHTSLPSNEPNTSSTQNDRDISHCSTPRLLTPNLTSSSLVQSARWVQRELPIRLAHRLHDFHRLPHIVVANSYVSQVHMLYCKAFAELYAYGDVTNLDDVSGFSQVLKRAVDDHVQVVSLMQKGVRELKVSHPDIVLDHFLDRLFVTRIGNRVLAEHHLAMHEDFGRRQLKPDYIGIINQRTQPAKMIRVIADRVAQVALRIYGRSPQVLVMGDVDIAFPYIPEHIRFVIFEMLKNAIRATVERNSRSANGGTDQLQPVTVAVHKGETEVFIKIQDKGGGMCPELLNDVWKYGFTTVRSPGTTLGNLSSCIDGGMIREQREMAGYGFGLPLSRLYTRYFGGDLDFKSMPGYGLDTYIRLPRLGTQRESSWMLNNHLHHLFRHRPPTPPFTGAHRGSPHVGAKRGTTRKKNEIKSGEEIGRRSKEHGDNQEGSFGFDHVHRPLTYTSINGNYTHH